MNDLNLRADIRGDKDEYLKAIAKWAVKYGDAVGCYESPSGDNPHVHVWIKTKSTDRAVRENFKKHFITNIGNDGYCLKQKAGDLRYIAKGERYPEVSRPSIFLNTMFTADEVEEAHNEGWVCMDPKGKKKKKRLTQAGTKQSPEERETTLNAITNEAKKEPDSSNWSYVKCFRYVTRWYRQNVGQMPQQHYGKSLVDGLYLNLAKTQGPYKYSEKTLEERENYIYRRWYNGEVEDDQVTVDV